MTTKQINIRDPYILVHEKMYYMYGTRSETCWGTAEGFDCYKSKDLENWEGPIEIFKRSENFFADRCFWAPECYFYEENFYLLTTFAGEEKKKGLYILKSSHPEGQFLPYSECLTPADWSCIDGTLYFEKETKKVFLFFSHSFEDSLTGDMCVAELTKDLKSLVEEPNVIFKAAQAPWPKPVPFAKAEFNIDEEVYFTDGPCVFRGENQELAMIWSSWGTCGYAVGVAISESKSAYGPWVHQEQLLFPENGGHGMVFSSLEGEKHYVLHYPNDKYKERPLFRKLVQSSHHYRLEE